MFVLVCQAAYVLTTGVKDPFATGYLFIPLSKMSQFSLRSFLVFRRLHVTKIFGVFPSLVYKIATFLKGAGDSKNKIGFNLRARGNGCGFANGL